MWKLELICLLIVAVFVAVRAKIDDEPLRFFRRLVLFFVAAWLAEDTVIHAYGFYHYSPDWTVFVDRVPLMVLLIWPVVIHSAWDLALRLFEPAKAVWAVPVLVLTDASLIEPIAVEAGLWRWTEPGVFGVPPIGIIGWALFAGFVVRGSVWAQRREARPLGLLVILGTAALTHLSLLALWWGLFRWINQPIWGWAAAASGWGLSVVATYLAISSRAAEKVPRRDMWQRVPASLFFLGLLLMYCRDVPALMVYAFAFVPPYMALMRRRSSNVSLIE